MFHFSGAWPRSQALLLKTSRRWGGNLYLYTHVELAWKGGTKLHMSAVFFLLQLTPTRCKIELGNEAEGFRALFHYCPSAFQRRVTISFRRKSHINHHCCVFACTPPWHYKLVLTLLTKVLWTLYTQCYLIIPFESAFHSWRSLWMKVYFHSYVFNLEK